MANEKDIEARLSALEAKLDALLKASDDRSSVEAFIDPEDSPEIVSLKIPEDTVPRRISMDLVLMGGSRPRRELTFDLVLMGGSRPRLEARGDSAEEPAPPKGDRPSAKK